MLPSGKVLVAGSTNAAELYNPSNNIWSTAGTLAAVRSAHTATLLPSEKVLLAAGQFNAVLNSAELFSEDLGIAASRRPVISTVITPVPPGGNISLTGNGFTGDSEASSGSTNASATNFPLVQIRSLGNEQTAWLTPATNVVRSATSYQSAALTALPVLARGRYELTMFANGVTSTASAECTVNATTALVTGIAAGSCIINADQPGNNDIAAAHQVTQRITVGAINQTISYATGPAFTVGGTGTVAATAASNLIVNYTTASAACTVGLTTGLVTVLSIGTCVITDNQPVSANYLAAPTVTLRITVTAGSQTLSFGPVPAITVGGSGIVTAASDKGLAVTLGCTTTPVCTMSGRHGNWHQRWLLHDTGNPSRQRHFRRRNREPRLNHQPVSRHSVQPKNERHQLTTRHR